jgi:hypothetical protein
LRGIMISSDYQIFQTHVRKRSQKPVDIRRCRRADAVNLFWNRRNEAFANSLTPVDQVDVQPSIRGSYPPALARIVVDGPDHSFLM